MKPYYKTELGELFCGDCLTIMKQFPDNHFDLTVTSPPYDNLRDYQGYTFDFESIARELFRVTKQGGMVVWVVGDKRKDGSRSLTHFIQAIHFKEIGFNIHDIMIWKKPNSMPFIQKDQYTPSFELMIICSKGIPNTTNLLKEKCKYAGKLLKTNTTNPESIRKRNSDKITKETKIKSNVWDFIVAGTNYGHPAIFPEKLANDHILSWSNENDLVLDCFLGSGTTAIACEKLNRRWVGTEISEKYCEIIKKRNDYK